MAYATAADLDAFVQDEVTAATATLLLELATGEVDVEVGASLTEDSYTETFTADAAERVSDTIWLVPAGWPVAVTTVVEDGTTLTAGDDYTVTADGRLVREDADWDGDVVVTYTTGFPADSTALLTARRIVLQLASMAAANPQGLDALTADGASPSFVVREGVTALPPVTLSTVQRRELERYRWRRRVA